MTDIFSGDPYLTLGPNGATLTYIGGQPVMDQGLENQAMISIFSGEEWAGNALIKDPNQKIRGGKFLKAANKPIAITSINDMEQGLVSDLDNPAFGRVTATVINPQSDRIRAEILIEPPGQDSQTIILTRHGLNWQAQALNPAHARV